MSVIPANVLANWREWWPDRAGQVAGDIRTRLAAAVTAWDLDALQPMVGGEVALVFAVRRGTREAVLKLNPDIRDPAIAAEGRALALWAARGVSPALWGVRDRGLTLLLERIRPGGSLRDAGAGAVEIVETIGALLPSVHLAAEPERFVSLAEAARVDGWFAALAGTREHDELARLCAPGPADRLLHIDLHWLNVLHGASGWLVIDPKPQLGDPHADVFAFFDGPPLRELPASGPAAREHLRRLIAAYARAAGLDRDRLEAWIRLRALVVLVQSGLDSFKGPALARLVDALG